MVDNRCRVAWASALGLTIALGATARAQGPPMEKPNVLVFVLDQLQADQLHCYGNPREDSPNIDGLARRGVRFEHFFTVASWTSPSFGALHTSLYPSKHGVTLFWRPGMPLINKDTPMMAPVFQDHGYYTGAFVNNGLAGQQLTGRGFDDYYEGQRSTQDVNITERTAGNQNTAPVTTTRVLAWLQEHGLQPFFLYVHFIEPHSPYDPPLQDDLFKSDAYPYLTNTGYDVAHGGLLRLAMLGDQQSIERLYQLYDGKIHFVDRYVGQILDRLQAMGLTEKTLVLLTSDHGELLYSHPKDFLTFDHRSLYDADLHIPLIIAGPGVPRGRVTPALASNVDTAPTLLAMAGLPPLGDAEGHSLAPVIEGKVQSENPCIFAEEDVAIPLRSVRTQTHKLILNLWTGREQLFDLVNDPHELTDVATGHPDTVKQLDGVLRAWMKENTPSREVQLRRWRIYTQPETVVTVDDQAIGGRLILTGGGWHSDSLPQSGDFDGACFWTEAGSGSRTAVWRNDAPMLGAYKISVYFGHPAVGRLATNAPFTIVSESGSQTVHVDFNMGAGQWLPLGTAQNPRYVEETDAADGAILVDAVRFERIER